MNSAHLLTLEEYQLIQSKLTDIDSINFIGTVSPNAQPLVCLNPDLTPMLDEHGNRIVKSPEQILAEAIAEFRDGHTLIVPFGYKITAIITRHNGNALNVELLHYEKEEQEI